MAWSERVVVRDGVRLVCRDWAGPRGRAEGDAGVLTGGLLSAGACAVLSGGRLPRHPPRPAARGRSAGRFRAGAR
ncbi:hypothetical protein GCM10017687_62950 [Streptomyces echinatus]|uniref:Uncharacterized protein n=1 Tax=Streptomyces echinatus TaxID=67293 RepID=A0A7W9PSC3_9ACTN|nr:hypothetical protein [Streptomyces echinatus]